MQDTIRAEHLRIHLCDRSAPTRPNGKPAGNIAARQTRLWRTERPRRGEGRHDVKQPDSKTMCVALNLADGYGGLRVEQVQRYFRPA
jgi:hypothetical protein